jgi:hypothetical protein
MIRMLPVIAAVLFAAAAHAQAPAPLVAPPDASVHPQLAALKSWLETRSPEAQQCALKGGLFLDADRHYRATKSEGRAVDALMQGSAGKLAGAERDRLQVVAVQVVSLAAALSTFDTDAASIAFVQMCMSRAQRPGFEPAPSAIRGQLEGASQCQAQHRAQSLDRKECVARAFRLQ